MYGGSTRGKKCRMDTCIRWFQDWLKQSRWRGPWLPQSQSAAGLIESLKEGLLERKTFMLLTQIGFSHRVGTIHLFNSATELNVLYRSLHTALTNILVFAVAGTLTLDIDSDGCLSSSGSSWVKDPAGVGTPRITVLRDNWKHADSWLLLSILHHCL